MIDPFWVRTIITCVTVGTFCVFQMGGLGGLLGHADIEYHYSEKGTVKLNLRKRKQYPVQEEEDVDAGQVSMDEFVRDITTPCHLNPWLFNGHLQTIWTVIRSVDVPVWYKRRIFEQEDPAYEGSFAADFVTLPFETEKEDPSLPPRTTYFTEEEIAGVGSQDTKPMLVVLHGLSGGSHELYLRHVLAPLTGKQGEWEAVVVNSRGCAKSKITSGILYNARATWDLRQMVKWLRRTFPNRPLFGAGFSLGANMMTNYLGEEGSECQLKAALIISSPWNLELGHHSLQSTWIGRNVYSRSLGKTMKRLVDTHSTELEKHNSPVDLEEVKKIKFLYEFDRVVQCPSWGYPTEGAYFRDSSSSDSAMAARVPFLAISALDDPVCSKESLPFQEIKQTPYGILLTTTVGGHLSWFEWGGTRWFAKTCVAFLQKAASELDLETPFERSAHVTLPSVVKKDPLRAHFDPMRRKLSRVTVAENGSHRP